MEPEQDAVNIDQEQWNMALQQKLFNEIMRSTQLEVLVQQLQDEKSQLIEQIESLVQSAPVVEGT